jgi:hypothetical protein
MEMSDAPKTFLTPAQWAVVEAHERRRTDLVEENTMKTLRFQAELLDKYTETLPAMKMVLSDRDQFAMCAMSGQLSGMWAGETPHGWSHDDIASEAYAMADAMMKAREA